ncbi:NEDD8-conjugating enzyme ube2f [Aphanomyces cochlioides]|nr:NEDD8-conjugating enzyme ube2f [Aphanomyces cochlioides]
MCSRLDLATLRVRKDVNELSKGKFTCSHATTRIEFPDGIDNLLCILIVISITDPGSPYTNGDFRFRFDIPRTYPFHAPLVFSLDRIWHPNIDINTGHVMFSILGKDWRPVLSINTILLGLQLIFIEPCIEFALNQAAAETYSKDPVLFRKHVQLTLRGGTFFGFEFATHPRQKGSRQSFLLSERPSCKRERELEQEIQHMSISTPIDCDMAGDDSEQSFPLFKRQRSM